MGMEKHMRGLVNLTAHDIHIYRDGELYRTIPPSGNVAHLVTKTEGEGFFKKRVFVKIINLPDPKEGVKYIVSSIIPHFLPHRTDLWCSASNFRDRNGNVVGATCLVRDGMLDHAESAFERSMVDPKMKTTGWNLMADQLSSL